MITFSHVYRSIVISSIATLSYFVAQPASAVDLPPEPPQFTRSVPTTPLVAVKPETLTSMRASSRVENVDYQISQSNKGPMVLAPDGLSTDGSATRAVREAFRAPFCLEWAYAESPRFPFAVEANERLVDALDKLKKNSDGYMQWMLLRGRIVLTGQAPARKGEIYVMDRAIGVEIEADTLEQALEQIETAYDKQYPDLPLVLEPSFPKLLLSGSPQLSGQPGKLVLKMEGALREVLLAVLDQMQDPAIVYTLSEITDQKGRRYYALRVKEFDSNILDRLPDAERAQLDALRGEAQQRLVEYLDRAEKAAKSAGKAPLGEAVP